MYLHPDKCETLRVTKKRKPLVSAYTIEGQSLKEVDSTKYLGVTMHRSLSWNTHVDKTCSKANSILGLLRRNLSNCPRDVKENCYKSLIRPTMEYTSTVWDPHTARNINKIEMVQRRSARFVFNDYGRTASPSDMMNQLGWESLAERRKKAKAVMMFKICKNLIDIPVSYFTPVHPHGRRSEQVFAIPYCRTDTFKFSFVPTGAKVWNNLKPNIRSLGSVDALKLQLEKGIVRN